jgi:hypothetical protein
MDKGKTIEAKYLPASQETDKDDYYPQQYKESMTCGG